MENIEQLQQDNAKLQERLNNAAKFFREQKAQIETLTQEKDNFNKQLNEYELKLQAIEKENQELKENYKSNDIAKGEAEINLESIQKEYTNKFNEQEAEIKKLTALGIDYVNQINSLKSNIESKDLFTKELQQTYNEVFAELEQFKKKYQARKEKEAELLKQIEDNELDYNKIKKEHDALTATYNKLNEEYSEVYKNYNSLQEQQLKANEKVNALNTLCIQMKDDNAELKQKCEEYEKSFESLKSVQQTNEGLANELKKAVESNKELQDKYDNLSNICNDFENQKLAADADYQTLLEKFNKLQENYSILENEKDIYSHSDDVLADIIKTLEDNGLINKTNITPQRGIKEDGKMHRIGSNMVTGENVGV